jgi:hypothetical protein
VDTFRVHVERRSAVAVGAAGRWYGATSAAGVDVEGNDGGADNRANVVFEAARCGEDRRQAHSTGVLLGCPGVPASALVRGFGCDSKVVCESKEIGSRWIVFCIILDKKCR